MRSIGLAELLTLFAIFALLPVIAIVLVVRFLAKRGGKQLTVASKLCGSCGQRVPDLGSFCPLCGQKI